MLCCRCDCRHRQTPGATPPPPVPSAARVSPFKGRAVRLIDEAIAAVTSDETLDVSQFNAVSLEIYPSGAGASAVVTVLGGPSKGTARFLPVIDPNSGQTITSNTIVDVIVGSAWVKVQLSSVTGTWTVIATPYIAPGPTALVASVN